MPAMPEGVSRHACAVCGKGRMQRHLVSHAKNNFVRYAHPNLRRMRATFKGAVRTAWVCAKCLKRGLVVPVLSRKLSRAAAPAR